MIKQIENFINLHKVRSSFENFLIFQFTQAQGLFDLLLDKNNTTVFHVFDSESEIKSSVLGMISNFIDLSSLHGYGGSEVYFCELLVDSNITINEFYDYINKPSLSFDEKLRISVELSLFVDCVNNLLGQLDFAIRDNNRKKALEND